MKKTLLCFCLMLSTSSLIACHQNSDTPTIAIEISDSTKFSSDEINQAIDCVKNYFSFPACTLTKIWYDETFSNEQLENYAQNGDTSFDAQNTIILLSEFHVDDSGENPVLTPNATYTNYMWVLTRTDASNHWEIHDFGL